MVFGVYNFKIYAKSCVDTDVLFINLINNSNKSLLVWAGKQAYCLIKGQYE